MSYDIGPKIGIDGESEFRKQLNNINTSLKTLGTEMKLVTSEFADNAEGQKALIAKNQVLSKTIDQQKEKIEQVEKALAECTEKYGENSDKTMKWQQVLNTAKTKLNSLENELKDNETALSEMESGLRDATTGARKAEKEFDETVRTTKELKDSFEKSEKSTGSFGTALKAAFLGGGIASSIQSICNSISQVIEETQEYRKIMGSLQTSSEYAGYTNEQTAQTYKMLYGVLADDQTAATATANLQALGLEQEELKKMTQGVIGAWSRYGDSIPIDGLAEAVNETVKVGQVTGTFADVLNWAGKSEDDFNKKLAACKSETERVNLVMEELSSQGLMEASEAWNKNNESLVANNQASAELKETMAEIAKRVEPLAVGAKKLFNEVLQGGLGLVDAFQENGVKGVIDEFGNIFTGLQSKKEEYLPELLTMGTEIASNMLLGITESLPSFIEEGAEMTVNIVDGVLGALPSVTSSAGSLVNEFLRRIVESAPDILESGVDMLLGVVDGVVNNLPEITAAATEVTGDFLNTICNNAPTLIEGGIELIGKLLAGIITAVPELIGSIPGIVSDIREEFLSIDWGEVGLNIVEGIANGLSGAVGYIVEAATNVASDALEAVKNFLGIHSPSTRFRDEVGKMAAEGMKIGFIGEMKISTAEILGTLSGFMDDALRIAQQPFNAVLDYDRLERMQGKGIYLNGRLVGRELREMGVVFA